MSLPNEFELKVMRLALRGSADFVIGMREQLQYLTVAKREILAWGFTTYLNCDASAKPVAIPCREDGLPISGYPPTVNAIRSTPSPGLVGFVVWIGRDGRINELEAFTYEDDKWSEGVFDGFHSFQDDNGNIIEN